LWQHPEVQDALMTALSARRPQIHARWETLLRAEKASTPLANPDALVHLIDWTLTRADIDCPCGRNPLLTYFAAGEQSLQESLVLSQAECHPLEPIERDTSLHELNLALRHIARREVGAFCALCQLRGRECAPHATANHAA
jgi:hypothetical protein